MANVYGFIPARYQSSRLPGKPLVKLDGEKTLIQLTYENAAKCPYFDQLIVATDDKRIFDHVVAFGGKAVMTSVECPTGTDRLVEALEMDAFGDEQSIIINIQGDAPCLEPHIFSQVIRLLEDHPEDVMSTAAVPITSKEEALSPSIVKCVMDKNGHALYFCRGLIPTGSYNPDQVYYHHLGIYGFRKKFLLHYPSLSPTPLMLAEDLEQLKVLEHGYGIRIAVVESESFGVDTPQDVEKIKKLLCKKNTSS